MIKCSGCGANMRFDPATQKLQCDYCGTSVEINHNSPNNVSHEENFFESTLFTCPNCGAEILSDSDTAVTFCSYCDASVMLEGRLVTMKAPSKVIPFKLPRNNVEEHYKKFINSAIFAPSYLKSEGTLQKLRGIYMPYWSYRFTTDSNVNFKGETSHRSGDYIIHEHYDLETRVTADYDGITYDASSTFADELSTAIAPYNIEESVDFDPAYLSGFYADTADVKPSVYQNRAKSIAGADATSKVVKSRPEFRKYGVSASNDVISPKLKTKEDTMAYFPVWFLASNHKGYVSYAVINGQTGKVAADIPIDYKKYIIGSLLLSLPIMLILNLMFTPLPSTLTIIGTIFAIISYIITNTETNRLYTRRLYLDDAGLTSVLGKPQEIKAAEQAQREKNAEKNKANNSGTAKPSSPLTTVAIVFYIIALACFFNFDSGYGDFVYILFFVSIWMGIMFNAIAFSSSKPVNVNDAKNKNLVCKQPFSEKKKIVLKPIAAIILAILLFIINPVNDIFYYICAFIIMALVLVSFVDVINLHNQLTMRVPRQFNKRGGDN